MGLQGESTPLSGTAEPLVLRRDAAPRVSILIATTKQAGYLRNCLRSLARYLPESIPYEVILVLNAATDEVKAVAREGVQGALVLESPVNLGLCGGFNRARSQARGEFLALLHDDSEIQPGWLESLLETVEAHPEAGIVAGMGLNFDGSLQNAGNLIWGDLTTSNDWVVDPIPAPESYTETRPIDYAGTNSMLIRTSTWDAFGGADENIYPAYYVDVDLCMSCHRAGQVVLFDPRSRQFHHRGSSSHSAYRLYMVWRNRKVMAEKWKAELAAFVPWSPHNQGALARAKAHTARAARELSERWKAKQAAPLDAPAAPAQDPPAFDAMAQELRHTLKARELKEGYPLYLEEQCADLTAQCQLLKRELHEAREQLTRTPLGYLKRRTAGLKVRLGNLLQHFRGREINDAK